MRIVCIVFLLIFCFSNIGCINDKKIVENKENLFNSLPSSITGDEVWTVAKLTKENPYIFDTILKNNFHLQFQYYLKSKESSIEMLLILKDGKKIVDTLNRMGYAAPQKNLGYIGADFKDYFVFVQSFGSGNPHDMQLLRKKDARKIIGGYFIDADEKNEILLYLKGRDSLMYYDVKKLKNNFILKRSNTQGFNIRIFELGDYLKIGKVSSKNIQIVLYGDKTTIFSKNVLR